MGWTVRNSNLAGRGDFSDPSRTVPWPSQPPTRWVLGLAGGKEVEAGADYHLSSIGRVEYE